MVPNFGPKAGGTTVTLSGHHFGSSTSFLSHGLDIFMNPDTTGGKANIILW